MKKHTGLYIGLIAAVIVLVGGAMAFIFAGDYLANSFALLTKNDTEYFQWLSEKQIKKVTTVLKAANKAGAAGKVEETSPSEVDFNLKVHAEDSFCDLLGIYPFKDIVLSAKQTIEDKKFASEIKPGYGSTDLMTIRLLTDLTNNKVYLQVPEYDEGVVEVSHLAENKIADSGDMGKFANDFIAGIDSAKTLKEREIDNADIFKKYAEYVLGNITEASLSKKVELTVDTETKKVNAVKIKFDADTLKKQLNGLVEMMYVDGLVSNPDARKDMSELIDRISPTTNGEIIEYVNAKAQVVGVDFSVFSNATKVGAQTTFVKGKEESGTWVKININSLCALDITAHSRKAKNGGFDYDLSVVPGAFVKKLIGDNSDYSASINITTDEAGGKFKLALNDKGQPIAFVEAVGTQSEFEAPAFTIEGRHIYEGDSLTSSEYIKLTKLVTFALDLIDKIDEEYINDYINSLLMQYFGEDMTIDTLREYCDMGLFDMFGGALGNSSADEKQSIASADVSKSEDTNGTDSEESQVSEDDVTDTENPEESAETAQYFPEGLIVVEPEDFKAPSYEMPVKDKTYYYSHSQLADYCIPADYTGLVYTVPEVVEVTPEMFESAKEDFLNSYAGTVRDESSDLTVDWGDEIYFDLVPVMRGMTLDSYKYTNQYAMIGDYDYGEGIDDLIIGMKVGDTKDVDAVLPEDFGDFSGYEVTIRVTIKEIVRYVEPSWTEDFICDKLGYSSIDACSDFIMYDLSGKDDAAPENIAYELIGRVKAESKYIPVPDDLYLAMYQEYYDGFYSITAEYGMRPEEYFISIGYTMEEFAEMAKEDVDSNINYDAFFAAVAKKENIALSGADLLDIIDDYLEYYEADSFEELMTYISLDSIIDYEIEDMIAKLIYSNAVIK